MSLIDNVKATLKSKDTEGPFELYVTRTPGYLWACFFKWLGVHPIAVTLMSIVIGDCDSVNLSKNFKSSACAMEIADSFDALFKTDT